MKPKTYTVIHSLMIDIQSLLEPISADTPCGEDMSFSHEFDEIQEARRSDDATLDQGEWITDLKTADWPAVARQCGDLLATRSKDLRLGVWMAEALAQTDGFAGMASGFDLVAGLTEQYWSCVHPGADENDDELRIGILNWLLTQSIQWLRSIPLTDAPQGRYDAIAVETAARGLSTDGEHPDTATIDAARAATSFEFYLELVRQIHLVQPAADRLEKTIDGHLGDNGPSFSALRDTLDNVCSIALRMAAAAGVTQDGTDMPTPRASQTEQRANLQEKETSSAIQANNGEIASRQEALMQLRRVADFFRRTEPHSPVAYLADKAARWGNMPLHVWLKTVLKDSQALEQLEDLLDVGTEPQPDKDG